MKAVLVFVFLSLLSASLATDNLGEQLDECYLKFPESEHKFTEDGPNDIAKQYHLCIFEVTGLYADGKFDVDGLIEEVRNMFEPETLVEVRNIIDTTVGRDDGETAVLIVKKWRELHP